MSEETRPNIKRISWLVWAALVVLVLVLASAFNRAWEVNQALQAQEALLEPMLTASVAEQATLQAQLTRVQSDAYVEEWAQQSGMTQEGVVLGRPVALPIATPQPTPLPTALPTPTPTPLPFWQRLWQGLTGGND